jgi:hypothetical protein
MSIPGKSCPWASEPLIIAAVCQYLDLGSRHCTFRHVSKGFNLAVKQLGLVHHEINNGKLPEPAGRAFSLILDVLRYAALDMGLSISKKAEQLVHSINDIHLLRQTPDLMQELQKLNFAMYSQWKNNVTGNAGVFNYLLGTMSFNPGMFKYKFDLDLVYAWPERRVCENFFVFCERKDGTILISEDLKVVYLVKGIAQSLGEVLPNRDMVPRPYMIRTTNLPFAGYIVYDGLLAYLPHHIKDDKALQKKLRATYSKAFNERKIRVREPQGDELGPPVIKAPPLMDPNESKSASSGQLAIVKSKISATSEVTLQRLKTLRKLTDPHPMSYWVLRRFDYTEKKNPEHLVTVMVQSGPLVMGFQYSALIPTIDDVISLVNEACQSPVLAAVTGDPCLPQAIAVDAIEIFEDCKTLFASIGLVTTYYPPPSAEEDFYFNGPSKDACLYCGKTEKDAERDGGSLMKCGRCKIALYCCKEHQKADWKKHKHLCM